MRASPDHAQSPERHIPVLIDEVLDALAINPGEVHVDGTVGAGGYSGAMADRGARVFAFDRDPDAIREGQALAEEKGVTLIAGEFSRMEQLLAERGVTSVSGVTLDIGVSSLQLDRPRSEARRVGKGWVSTCNSRGSP